MDNVTASCRKCDAPVKVANNTPHDQIVVCGKCGAEVGTYGDIRQAMIDKGLSEVQGAVADMIKNVNKRLR